MERDNFKVFAKYAVFIFAMCTVFLLVITVFVIGIASFADSAYGDSSKEDSISRVGYSGDIDIYEDGKTGVQYLIYKDKNGLLAYSGMCPRYNADGSLYTGDGDA